MTQGFKESDFQNGVFIPYLSAPQPGGLDWILGKPADIDAARWIVPGDLLRFLRDGCPLNAAAFAKAVKGYDSDADFLRAFMAEVLLPKIEAKANAAFVLREGLTFAGQSFVLWNEAPRAGAESNAAELFRKNFLRVIPEATFERQFPYSNKRIRRRPDVVFFVNGLYLAYSELKAAQTGQTAAGHGRKKIAHDCVEAGIAVLREARERYAAEGGRWPGFRHRDLSEKVRWEIRQSICLYEKATHISGVDMGAMVVLSDIEWLLPEIDDAIEADDTQALVEILPAKVVEAFMRTAEMREKPASVALAEHLASFFSPADGVDREIHFFNQNRPSRTTTGTEILRPRPAQRAMLYQTMRRVRELYAEESKSKINETDIRASLSISLPDLDTKKVDEIVRKTLLHRNGQESHSVLLQGAAGLGKTNVIVWLAQALADMADPRSPAAAPLFDLCILLTDRTELRQNVAEEAARLRATQGIVTEAETFKDLRDGLQDGVRVVVVNIQKFPSIKRLADADPALAKLLADKRVAFVVDEVHRTQNGILHDATIEIFDEWGTIRPEGAKRNLIVGLTATPRDEILARFGEWRSPVAAGDDIRWVPYFAYTMTQAIRDRVILNPIQNVIRFEDHLQYKITESVQKLKDDDKLRAPSSDEIYQNPNRQAFVAKQAALVFVAKTMMTIRPPGRALGEGKGMFAAHSIKAAIAYQKLLRAELDALADDPRFIEHAESIKACPVLLLYTDKQGEASCASLNDGRNQDAIIDEFRRKGEGAKQGLKVHNALIVVVDKLLTGFDEPTLHTLFIDRGMDDVLLFQAACRVNRWRKWKNDCLLVDFSHEGIVSKNLPKVFAKYGGITVSDLDAMNLKEKMDKAFKVFFDDKGISTYWRSWKAAQDGGKNKEVATGLSDFLDGLTKDDKPRASNLRKTGSAWMGSRERLWGILDFKKAELAKHANEKRAAFVEQVVKHLASKLRDEDDRVGAVFDIDLVEDAVGWGLDELPEASEKKKKSKGDPGLPHSIGGLMASLDAIELLAALQLTEQQKLLLIEKLKAFLIALFQIIDGEGKRRNNDIHRKMVLAMANEGADFPWEDRYAKFKELLDAGAINLKIHTHPDRKALLIPLMKRAELVMADYEEWIVSGGQSIAMGEPTLQRELKHKGAATSDDGYSAELISYVEIGRAQATQVSPKPEKATGTQLKVWFGTNRARNLNASYPAEAFDETRSSKDDEDALSYGRATVSIPATHVEGKVDKPTWWRLEFKKDPAKHMVLTDVTAFEHNAWVANTVEENCGATEGLLFIHGFNVSFEEALLRTAQLVFDLKFQGVPLAFSWASGGKILNYPKDSQTIEWSIPMLRRFLEVATQELGLTKLHVIAHSMGNRALTRVLSEWETTPGAAKVKQVVFAAPDVDLGIFKQLVAKIKAVAQLTLYSSRTDRAIKASKKFHAGPRAGDGDPPCVISDVVTVDVSKAGKEMFGLGHGYFAGANAVFTDLYYLIREVDVVDRKSVAKAESGNYFLLK